MIGEKYLQAAFLAFDDERIDEVKLSAVLGVNTEQIYNLESFAWSGEIRNDLVRLGYQHVKYDISFLLSDRARVILDDVRRFGCEWGRNIRSTGTSRTQKMGKFGALVAPFVGTESNIFL